MTERAVNVEPSIPGYTKVHNIGHKIVDGVFKGPVVIQEKVDGSQYSFQFLSDGVHYRSHHVDITHQPHMFAEARTFIESIKEKLTPGWIYRGEFLKKRQHNALTYDRVPTGHVILWDVETGPGKFLSPEELAAEAARIGLECVPCYYVGELDTSKDIKTVLDPYLARPSVLGGKTEGIVIKNYDKFGPDDKLLAVKWVSPEFKEVHKKEWGEANPTQKDVVQRLIDMLRTDARYVKARQHLSDKGLLTGEMRDIALLVKEVQSDVKDEEEDWIKQQLFDHFWPIISRAVISGIPTWYKGVLADNVFGDKAMATGERSDSEVVPLSPEVVSNGP